MHPIDESATPSSQPSRRSFLATGSKFLVTAAALPAVPCLPQIQAFLLETGGIVALDLSKKLYDKLLEYISGNAITRVFPEPTIRDVNGWIQGAVVSIEAKIDQLSARIDANNLSRMQADLAVVRNALADYASLGPANRKANRQYLYTCDQLSTGLLTLSQNYDQALFLGNVSLAHLLLARYALYELDLENGPDASGHITSLLRTGDVQRYFSWAAGARARLVDSLAPQYSINCTEQKPLLYGLPTTQCEISRRGKPAAKTGVMSWSDTEYKTELDVRRGTIKKAMDRMTLLSRRDVEVWRSVNRCSGENIAQGAKCLRTMYYNATGYACPAFFNDARLELHNTASFSTGWNGDLKPGRPWGP